MTIPPLSEEERRELLERIEFLQRNIGDWRESDADDVCKIVRHYEATLAALTKRVEELEANQRTPGTVEVCDSCGVDADKAHRQCFGSAAQQGEESLCPIRQPKAQTTSAPQESPEP